MSAPDTGSVRAVRAALAAQLGDELTYSAEAEELARWLASVTTWRDAWESCPSGIVLESLLRQGHARLALAARADGADDTDDAAAAAASFCLVRARAAARARADGPAAEARAVRAAVPWEWVEPIMPVLDESTATTQWLAFAASQRWRVNAALELLPSSACDPARQWVAVSEGTPERLWDTCQRGDWMLWLCARIGVDRKLVVLAACDCAETAPGHSEIPAAVECIRVTRAWCRGEAAIDEVRMARRGCVSAATDAAADADAATTATDAAVSADAAAAAAATADAAATTATAATAAVSAATAATTAVSAATAAVSAATAATDAAVSAATAAVSAVSAVSADAAAAAAAAAADVSAARSKSLARSADLVRARVPWVAVHKALAALKAGK